MKEKICIILGNIMSRSKLLKVRFLIKSALLSKIKNIQKKKKGFYVLGMMVLE